MMLRLFALSLLLAAQTPPKPADPPPQAPPAGEEKPSLKIEKITRLGPDGVTLTADFCAIPVVADDRPMFVCFHMEGGSRAEYSKIAQRFGDYACFTLAVDLRTGKATNDVPNETATSAASVLKKTTFTNEEAFADVVEALKWARELRPRGKIFAVGSGTSAALVLVAAARDPACADAVLVFSPGEDVAGWSIAMESKKIAVPTFITCDGTPKEGSRTRMIGNSIDKKLRRMIIPTGEQGAAHGSTVLVQSDLALRDRYWGPVVKLILESAPTSAAPAEDPLKKPG